MMVLIPLVNIKGSKEESNWSFMLDVMVFMECNHKSQRVIISISMFYCK